MSISCRGELGCGGSLLICNANAVFTIVLPVLVSPCFFHQQITEDLIRMFQTKRGRGKGQVLQPRHNVTNLGGSSTGVCIVCDKLGDKCKVA